MIENLQDIIQKQRDRVTRFGGWIISESHTDKIYNIHAQELGHPYDIVIDKLTGDMHTYRAKKNPEKKKID